MDIAWYKQTTPKPYHKKGHNHQKSTWYPQKKQKNNPISWSERTTNIDNKLILMIWYPHKKVINQASLTISSTSSNSSSGKSTSWSANSLANKACFSSASKLPARPKHWPWSLAKGCLENSFQVTICMGHNWKGSNFPGIFKIFFVTLDGRDMRMDLRWLEKNHKTYSFQMFVFFFSVMKITR